MARRKIRPRLGVYEGPPEEPAANVADIVEEGVLIAAAAVRMAVKNRAIVRTLRDLEPVGVDWYAAAVHDELLTLAREKADDAERVGMEIGRAATKTGQAQFHGDFRRRDLPTMRRRLEVLERLIGRLSGLADDRGYVDGVLSTCRAEVSEEIADAIRRRALLVSPRRAELNAAERATQLAGLEADIARLSGGAPDLAPSASPFGSVTRGSQPPRMRG